MRIVRNISIKWLYAILYALVFALVIFSPNEFIALAFDGSGATTGDVSVPFILAHGLCFFLPVEMSTLTIHGQETDE